MKLYLIKIIFFPFRKICSFFHCLQQLYLKMLLGHVGKRTYIYSPLYLDGSQHIFIGSDVRVGYKAWLAAVPWTGESCSLVIKDNCYIGNFNHIYATKRVVLEKGVMTADKVYISDNLHSYENIHLPIKDQSIIQNGEVVIGEGSWLGENVCVLGAKIGKHCVIGANSVVTKDIPDYCVAVGIPAKIIKHYDFTTQSWRKTNPQGEFLD